MDNNLKWISVIEKLPKNKQIVLCFNADIAIATFHISAKGIEWEEPYYGQEIASPFENVTHWMPMPKTPQEKK